MSCISGLYDVIDSGYRRAFSPQQSGGEPGKENLTLVLVVYCTSCLIVIFVFVIFNSHRTRPRSALSGKTQPSAYRPAIPPRVDLPSWPLVGQTRSLGAHPHRALSRSIPADTGGVGTVQLGRRTAVVLTGVEAIRSAVSASPSQRGLLDDRPDFSAYRRYSDGLSVSFGRDCPALRSQRRLAARAIARLVSTGPRRRPAGTGASVADRVVSREAEKLVRELLNSDGGRVDPRGPVSKAVSSALYSMCYGLDLELDQNEDYAQLLLNEDNPGTQQFAIGQQVSLIDDLNAVLFGFIMTENRSCSRDT